MAEFSHGREALAAQAARRALACRLPGPVLPRLRLLTTAELLCPAPPPGCASDAAGELSALCAAAGQMLRRPAFWLYFLWATALSAAGLAVIGNGSMIAQEIGASASAAAAITGMLSVCSGLGRVAIGLIFDRFGRAASAVCTNVLMVLAMLVALQNKLKEGKHDKNRIKSGCAAGCAACSNTLCSQAGADDSEKGGA